MLVILRTVQVISKGLSWKTSTCYCTIKLFTESATTCGSERGVLVVGCSKGLDQWLVTPPPPPPPLFPLTLSFQYQFKYHYIRTVPL